MNEPWYLTREQVRAIDATAMALFHMPGVLLMENAGRGAAETLARLNADREPVLIVCGEGNNGGDGFVIARHLQNLGITVELRLFAPMTRRGSPRLSDDAAINFEIAKSAEIPLVITDLLEPGDWLAPFEEACRQAGWIVDALFGTGLTRPVAGVHAQAIETINASGKKIFAIDLPSGLNANSGESPGPTVRAGHTATFVAHKAGFQNSNAKLFTGEIHVIDIGVPKKLLDEARRDAG
ncbi:NAD(P)H-hydrate epimerase [Zavarzinella formosa]|uniref:NAD(P)H-hydrate epimerase n=1 Tax=Zavarzinella formosa TaxID=360055 RepID=UPI0002DC4E03|nr:NAD(P)H-hydrate epimerase [Zavarzinella formosa]